MWQDASCNGGTCRCANSQPAFITQDGPVCLYGACPTANGLYTKFVQPDGSERSCVGGLTQLCPPAYDCICTQPGCGGTTFCCPKRGTPSQPSFSPSCPSLSSPRLHHAAGRRQRQQLQHAVVAFVSLKWGVGRYLCTWPRYYYNSAQKACLTFFYRGSQGNANNFYSLSQCESYCMQGSSPLSHDIHSP